MPLRPFLSLHALSFERQPEDNIQWRAELTVSALDTKRERMWAQGVPLPVDICLLFFFVTIYQYN